ncbi:hypothetical protein MLP_39850 [Microlunatus phosphovorus NM-1]|uniref:Uncharacterized protein n=1 Tax=Microlunatus phosphovorus (strain ATCC 700054 / DSM 10555 / JCM 9379 / NBRC 101784 / NCIMB 13414 / VKM Ac-1990 / NM-1) TaxID=1032480 RepID=F5XQX7_MICPN|nr:hypothetical protein MLP_39850 [Microlunatus phosphovorus NM-1]
MPWSPDWPPTSDPRLDLYRDQVAVLERDGSTVGHVLILTESFSTRVGGLLLASSCRTHTGKGPARPPSAVIGGPVARNARPIHPARVPLWPQGVRRTRPTLGSRAYVARRR